MVEGAIDLFPVVLCRGEAGSRASLCEKATAMPPIGEHGVVRLCGFAPPVALVPREKVRINQA